MTSKLSTWLLLALAGGAFVAGCGSSNNSTSSSQSTTTATTTAAPAVTPLTPAQARKAVSACKSTVQRQSSIPKSARGTLEKTCEKAASSGSAAALGKVAEEACVDLINASHLPGGVIRERALATCKVNSSVGR